MGQVQRGDGREVNFVLAAYLPPWQAQRHLSPFTSSGVGGRTSSGSWEEASGVRLVRRGGAAPMNSARGRRSANRRAIWRCKRAETGSWSCSPGVGCGGGVAVWLRAVEGPYTKCHYFTAQNCSCAFLLLLTHHSHRCTSHSSHCNPSHCIVVVVVVVVVTVTTDPVHLPGRHGLPHYTRLPCAS